jgi:flagellar motor switch protein FliN/FliY
MSTQGFVELLQLELERAIPEVFALVSGQQWKTLSAEAQLPGIVERFSFQLEGSVSGKFAFGLSVASAKKMAGMFLGTSSDGDVLSDDDRDACAEACRQIVGMAIDRMRADRPSLKAEFQVGESGQERERVFEARFTSGETVLAILLFFSSDIREQATAESQVSHEEPQGSAASRQSLRADSERNLALLLDVNLAVTLRFGGRELLLKDVLELSSGSVLELDRDVHEPVDLLLNDRVIARGEVVIVDGNYGLRVNEIPVAS